MGGGNPLKKIERETKRVGDQLGGEIKRAGNKVENKVKNSPVGSILQGKNPIKSTLGGMTDAVLGGAADLAGSLGAEGLEQKLDETSGSLIAMQGNLVDRTTGKYDDMKEDAAAAELRFANDQKKQANEAKAKEAAAEQARLEEERMAPGRRAKNLLTGGMGVDDVYGGAVSKRKLSGR